MTLNWEEIRAMMIRAHGIKRANDKFAFFYDETNISRAAELYRQQLEVSALSIWKWESGGAAPRASRVPAILHRLSLGKREALALLTAKAD